MLLSVRMRNSLPTVSISANTAAVEFENNVKSSTRCKRFAVKNNIYNIFPTINDAISTTTAKVTFGATVIDAIATNIYNYICNNIYM